MSDDVWISLGRRDDVESIARVWKPGDGVQCSSASYQRREPCGPPVAVIETLRYVHNGWGYMPNRQPSEEIEKRIRRITCAEHLAGKVGAPYVNQRAAAITSATKKASEEVLARHWKQYQTLYAKYIDEAKTALIEAIPEPLREAVQAALDKADELEDAS
jgi:hypothetical protein